MRTCQCIDRTCRSFYHTEDCIQCIRKQMCNSSNRIVKYIREELCKRSDHIPECGKYIVANCVGHSEDLSDPAADFLHPDSKLLCCDQCSRKQCHQEQNRPVRGRPRSHVNSCRRCTSKRCLDRLCLHKQESQPHGSQDRKDHIHVVGNEKCRRSDP